MPDREDIELHIEPMGADEIHQVSLEQLPRLIRLMSERKAALDFEWQRAYRYYKERRGVLIEHLHRDRGLGITAASNSASLDPNVVEASDYSLRLKGQLAELERAEAQLQREYEVKLTLARLECQKCA